MTPLSTPAAQGTVALTVEDQRLLDKALMASTEVICAIPSPEALPASGVVLEALLLARTALVSSKPVMAHYEEPLARHKAAFDAVEAAIAALTSAPAPEDRT